MRSRGSFLRKSRCGDEDVVIFGILLCGSRTKRRGVIRRRFFSCITYRRKTPNRECSSPPCVANDLGTFDQRGHRSHANICHLTKMIIE